ncbi:MAG: bacterioferritin-associated ferredoxin [Ectothiorhodospira sp.]
MYVCLCRQVTDHRIREAIAEGADTLEALQDRLGVTLECGQCADQVADLLRETREVQAPVGEVDSDPPPSSPWG